MMNRKRIGALLGLSFIASLCLSSITSGEVQTTVLPEPLATIMAESKDAHIEKLKTLRALEYGEFSADKRRVEDFPEELINAKIDGIKTLSNNAFDVLNYNRTTDTPSLLVPARGEQFLYTVDFINPQTVEGLARTIVTENQAILKTNGDDLVIKRIKNVRDHSWLVEFKQLYKGALPVHGGNVVLRFKKVNINRQTYFQLYSFGSDYYSDIPANLSVQPVETTEGILNAVKTDVYIFTEGEDEATIYMGPYILPVIVNDETNEVNYHRAYQVRLHLANARESWIYVVDADTVQILQKYKTTQNATLEGNVSGEILPQHINDEPVLGSISSQYVDISSFGRTETDREGNYSVDVSDTNERVLDADFIGPYIAIHRFEQEKEADGSVGERRREDSHMTDHVVPVEVNASIWDDSNSSMEERNVFYHLNKFRDYITDMEDGLRYEGMNRQIIALVGLLGGNSWYIDHTYEILFGAGGFALHNQALFSDWIYHEYQHAVSHDVNPEFYLGSFPARAAISEGLSDYFACSFNDDSLWADGTGINAVEDLKVTRNLENNYRFPKDAVDASHYNGIIFAGALWDFREALIQKAEREGRTRQSAILTADRLVLDALRLPFDSYDGFYQNMFFVDDDNGRRDDGTPHFFELNEAIGKHGFLGNRHPLFLFDYYLSDESVNNNGVLDPQESATIHFSVANTFNSNSVTFQNVSATISTEDPQITIVDGDAELGTIGPREESEGQFQIANNESTGDQNIIFDFEITSESPLLVTTDQIEIRLLSHKLTVSDFQYIDDEANFNLTPEPGEQGKINFQLRNHGHFDEPNVSVRLSTQHTDIVTIINDELSLGTLPRWEHINNHFEIIVNEGATPGLIVDFTVDVLVEGDLLTTETFQLAIPQLLFSDHALTSGITGSPHRHVQKALLGDYDGDGDEDMYLIARNEDFGAYDTLFRNNGDGTYTDVTRQAGMRASLLSLNAAFFDFNNDGWLDIVIKTDRHILIYQNNGDTTFSEISQLPTGLFGEDLTEVLSPADFDRDGDLDLFTGLRYFINHHGEENEEPFAELLWEFEDYLKRAVTLDYDNDGDPDIFGTSFPSSGILYRNDGEHQFTNLSREAGVEILDSPGLSRGNHIRIGDYDNDGWLDIFITSCGARDDLPVNNVLFRNNGADATFMKATSEAGVQDLFTCGYPVMADFDNDGDLDIYVANESNDAIDMDQALSYLQLDNFYQNNGDGTFNDLMRQVEAVYQVSPGERGANFRLSLTDFNDDGYADIYMTNSGFDLSDLEDRPYVRNYALNNQFSGNHWLKVKLRGTESNINGIGARIKIIYAGKQQIREVTHNSGDSLVAMFGLGDVDMVERMEITWPSGLVQTLEDMAANQTYHILEGVGPIDIFLRGDSNDDERVNAADAVYTLEQLFLDGPASQCADAADVNDDGFIDIGDVLYTLFYVFVDGSNPPPVPYPNKGRDPTADDLGCRL